jgi:CRP-like cAMP-binding protein
MTDHLQDILCESCPEGQQHFFNTLARTDLQVVNEGKKVLRFKKGEELFAEGQKPQGIFCLREGKVKIFKHCFDGREQVTRLVFPAEFMGLKALLSGNHYTVSASTLEDSVVCFIRKGDFFQLMLKYPEFTQAIIMAMSRLLEEAENRMISLAHKPVRQRLAETLLFLNRSFHATTPAYPKPYLNLTRADLANIIGATPETVIRLLSEFREERIIEIRGRKIFVLDVPKLRLTANLRD